MTRFHKRAMTPLAVAAIALIGCSDAVVPTAAPSASAIPARFPVHPPLATTAWQALARSLVMSHRTVPIDAARIYALLAMAQYGGIVAVDGPGVADGTLPAHGASYDAGGRARFERERGAVAGASAQLLAYSFPDAAAALELNVSDDLLLGAGGVHPEFTKGVAAGRAMGDVMIAWARSDRFDTPWTGTIPTGPGLWIANGPPSGPLLGNMRPYFMSGGSQFRPDAPPAIGSQEFITALAEVSGFSRTRTAEQLGLVRFWALGPGTPTALGYWNEIASRFIVENQLDERAAAHVLAVTNTAAVDADIGCYDAKYTYLLLRPSQADASITLPIGLPPHPSYPSGHSCMSAAAAGVLSAYFPEHTDALRGMVTQAGMSRVHAGIHYRFDVEAGQNIGYSVADLALRYDLERGVLAAVR